MADLIIPQQIIDDIIAHAKELAPHECCGFLAGVGNTVTKVYRIKNVVSLEGAVESASFDEAKVHHLSHLSPEERAEIAFIMDSAEMFHAVKDIRKQNLRLQVVYHSHPKDPARPSPTDLKIANDWEDSWSQLNLTLPMYLLISLKNALQPDVKTYWIKSGEYTLADVQIN